MLAMTQHSKIPILKVSNEYILLFVARYILCQNILRLPDVSVYSSNDEDTLKVECPKWTVRENPPEGSGRCHISSNYGSRSNRQCTFCSLNSRQRGPLWLGS